MLVTVVAPRKDLTEEHRNAVQRLQRRMLADFPYVTGWYGHDDPDMWSMSRAVNVGRGKVRTPGLVITPSDYLLDPRVVTRAAAMLDDHPWVGLYGQTLVLPQAETLDLLSGRPIAPDAGGTMLGVCVPGIAVRTDVFDDVGGMDPRFQGWGPEDAALRLKLTVLHGDPPPPPGDVVVEMWSPGQGQWSGHTYFGATPNRAANELLFLRYMDADTPEAMRALLGEHAPVAA